MPIRPENVYSESESWPENDRMECESTGSSDGFLSSFLNRLESPVLDENVAPPVLEVTDSPDGCLSSFLNRLESPVVGENDTTPVQETDNGNSNSLDYEDFYATAVSSVSCESAETDTGFSRLQFLLDDPLILQDLIIEEKARCLDQDVDLPFPADQKCQAILWSRLHRAYQSERFQMSLTRRFDEPVVMLSSLANAAHFSTFSTNVKDVRNWTGVPSFVKELICPLNALDCAAKYALLIYDAFHGWELIGCLPTFASPVSEKDEEVCDVSKSHLFNVVLSLSHIWSALSIRARFFCSAHT